MENDQKPKLLIVDDIPTNIDMLRNLLKKEYQIYASTTGKQALHLAQTKKPDMILLDIMMPEMDGYEVCQHLKNNDQTKDIPVLFITALDSVADEEKCLLMGAVDYITKPFNMITVQARIKTHLELKNHRDKLENLVQERTREVQEARREIICRLSLVSEYRDNNTGLHIKRISSYCRILAKGYGLSETDCDLIYHASPMHDIGKIAIPDSILLKPGPLNSYEYDIMKTHTTIGRNILSGKDAFGTIVFAGSENPLIEKAKTIAYTHHEKWDGSGYPEGNHGTNIPIEGRITGVADVFDALTTERPYKKEWDVDIAIREIVDQSGKHFDPDVITVFQANISDIIKLKKQLAS